jgi:NAD(P)-dependent dehydrogenase (short-subunit alcohol dehydrogenase family)
VARQLAERDYQVILTVRDEDRARAAAAELAGDVRGRRLDVADLASVGEASRHGVEDPGELDVLVDNAGIGSDFGVAGADPDFEAIQRALDTNFSAPTGSPSPSCPCFGAAPSARRERLERDGRHHRDGRLVTGLSRLQGRPQRHDPHPVGELQDDGVLVNSACPGFVNTDMGGAFGATKPVADGAAGVVWLATLPDDGPTGGFFRDGRPIAF